MHRLRQSSCVIHGHIMACCPQHETVRSVNHHGCTRRDGKHHDRKPGNPFSSQIGRRSLLIGGDHGGRSRTGCRTFQPGWGCHKSTRPTT